MNKIIIGLMILVLLIILFYNNKNYEHFSPFDNKRVVVSLTTSPLRLPLIENTLLSLQNQTRKPDLIYLNVPDYFKRNCDTYDDNKILELINTIPILKINKCKDIGPLTKVIPVLDIEKDPETIIIVCDDDHHYENRMIEELLKHSSKYPDKVIANSSYTLNDIKLPEGFRGVLYKRKFFDDDIKNFIEETNTYRHCYTSDDYVLGYYLNLKNIDVYIPPDFVLAYPKNYGLTGDALHNESLPNNMRYNKCHKFINRIVLKKE